jgi:hypothetical protein
MRLFTLKSKIRRIALFAPKAAEIPIASEKARAAVHYNTMEKAALVRERRSIRRP